MHLPGWLIALAPVASFVGGYLFRYFGDYLNARWQERREKTARDAEHDRVLRERREAYELEKLGALSRILEVQYRTFSAYRGALLWHKKQQTPAPGDDERVRDSVNFADLRLATLSKELMEGQREAIALAELVLDNELRSGVIRAIHRCGVGTLHLETWGELWRTTESCLGRIGAERQAVNARIRGIYLNWPIPLEDSAEPTALESAN